MIAIVVDDDVVLGMAAVVDMGSKKSGIRKRHRLRWCLDVVQLKAGSFERLEPLSGGWQMWIWRLVVVRLMYLVIWCSSFCATCRTVKK